MEAHGPFLVVHPTVGIRATGSAGGTTSMIFFVGGGRKASTLRRRRWVVGHGWTSKVGREIHCSSLHGGGGVVVSVGVVAVAVVCIITDGVSSTRLGRRPRHGSMMVGRARVGTHLHLLVARWSGTFLVSAFFAAGGSLGYVDSVSLGHVQLMKNRGALPARRAGLGAVGGGCGATRIP